MNKFNGTKGEWKQEHRIIDEEGMYGTEVFSGDTVICSMHWAGERIGNTTYSRRGENAKLIASAPKMLEALQNLENDDNSIPEHAWRLVQDAIECAVGNEA